MRRACLAALLLIGRLAVAQSPAVVVKDAGPGPVGRYLTTLLANPATRVIVADTVLLPVDSVYPASVVVIGRRASVAGTVRGDVVVVGGDLFIKPRARIDGEGIAIGGGAYGSMLGIVRGGLTSHRDFTYDAVSSAGRIELQYRETYVTSSGGGMVSLPALYGLHLPTYDRSNGVSLPIGPAISAGPATLDLLATYRSQIGRVDPSVSGTFRMGRKTWVEGFAGRETRSNEAWINGPFSNSLHALLSGRDERNWYRATGGWLTINRKFETATMTSTYSVGGAMERASAARPDLFPTGGPWSFTGRRSAEGMYRPNPQVPGGTITGALAGAKYQWTAGAVKARLDMDLEIPLSAPTGQFVQTTIDGRIDFPTFGAQRYRFEAHGVLTTGDTAPMQRFAYLGGSGTLPTEELLTFGGDELLFIESRYEIPIPAVQLPFIGSPTLTFRHILGSAGVQTLPDITQIIGARLSVPFVRAELLMDTGTRKLRFRAGLSLSR